MTAKNRRILEILAASAGLGLLGVAVMIYTTWPANTLGNYLQDRRNRQENIRLLTARIEREADPPLRRFYQGMLAEEKGDLEGAIRTFRAARDEAGPGTRLRLQSAHRLGLAYGLNGQPEQELATYQALMDEYPGASRLSQAVFHLKRDDKERARRLLDEALARDEKDGSLGSGRNFALRLRSGLGSEKSEATRAPR